MYVVDISKSSFRHLFDDQELFLPIRWNGSDYHKTLKDLFGLYTAKIEQLIYEGTFPQKSIQNINRVIRYLLKSVEHYLNGFPSKAYSSFNRAMTILMEHPLKVYQKSILETFDRPMDPYREDDALHLFRAVRVEDNKPYPRARVFHTPYTLRSKVSTNRYSIAGYPSLYLGTTLELCCEEVHINPHQDLALAALFKLDRNIGCNNINIQVIELGVKPQDFLESNYNIEASKRTVSHSLLNNTTVKSAYLLWYPLIAACSYIRTNKNDPFAAEYIIPQLLMQWVRSEINSKEHPGHKQLVGIRYFSCASIKASDMGFNYVFPTSGQIFSNDFPYCTTLTNAFLLTKPVYIHEYDNLYACEKQLECSNDFKHLTDGLKNYSGEN